MKITKRVTDNDGIAANLTFDEVDTCPVCHKKIKPHELASSTFLVPADSNNDLMIDCLSIMYLCRGCYHTFVTQHLFSTSHELTKLLFTSPEIPTKKVFDEKVNELSEEFVSIYNEALAAESLGSVKVAGIGYRMALEFLIKDFFIKCHPGDEHKEKISKMHLGQFFGKNQQHEYTVTNDKLNIIALASVWIGNDFAHYERLHKDYSIDDLKNLIDTTLYYISLELNVLMAQEIIRK